MREEPRAVDEHDDLVEQGDLAGRAQRALQALRRRDAEAEQAVDLDRVVDVQAGAQLLGVVERQLPADLEEPHVGGAGGDVARAAAGRRRGDRGERRGGRDRDGRGRREAQPLAKRRQRDGRRDRGGRGDPHAGAPRVAVGRAARAAAQVLEHADVKRPRVGPAAAVGAPAETERAERSHLGPATDVGEHLLGERARTGRTRALARRLGDLHAITLPCTRGCAKPDTPSGGSFRSSWGVLHHGD